MSTAWFSVKNLLQSDSYNNKYEWRWKWASAIEIVEVYNILYSLGLLKENLSRQKYTIAKVKVILRLKSGKTCSQRQIKSFFAKNIICLLLALRLQWPFLLSELKPIHLFVKKLKYYETKREPTVSESLSS